MSNLGNLCAAVAAQLGIEDSGKAAVAIRIECHNAMYENRAREFAWNTKEWTLTPLVVGQYAYAQGPTTSELPEDWVAPADYAGPDGNRSAWIASTADLDELYPFVQVGYGRYRRLRQQYRDVDDRPRFWTVADEGILIVPSADVTTYKIFGRYIYNTDENWVFGITAGAWSGSNDSYTSDFFDQEKGLPFLINEVASRVAAGYLKDLEGASGHVQSAAKSLGALAREADGNVPSGRITSYW